VLELARSGAPLKAAVSFHGLLKTHAPAEPGIVATPVQVWTGGRDPYAPLADLEALRAEFDAAGVDYQATLFAHAQHSFTDPDHDGLLEGIAYDRVAHRVAWAGTLALLDTTFGR
jgi:dienelactone hydrolase